MVNAKQKNEDILFRGVLRINVKFLGLVLGLLMGFAIFIATNWLLIKAYATPGEQVVGPHLQLLGQFFIGYKVSFFGSIIGFAYGFAGGTLGGAFIGWIYNNIADIRNG